MKRAIAAFGLLLAAAVSRTERVLLVPLDSRPAAGQFAQMIGSMASTDVRLPPYASLGRFTQPGDPEQILTWLEQQDYSGVTSVVVSTDMLAYGGLIASRVGDSSEATAIQRLKRFQTLRRKLPQVRFFGFSAIMRLAPTATKTSSSWRLILAKHADHIERYRQNKDPKLLQTIKALEAKIPPGEIKKYNEVRNRNHRVQQELIRMTQQGLFDFLVFGQDDAQPTGPHIGETGRLKAFAEKISIQGRTYFCEGIDQLANVLISRALLRTSAWTPRVRLVYSDDRGKKIVADYESKIVEQSLRDQIFASGARPANPNGEYDYTLYVNTPDRREETFSDFVKSLAEEVDQGFPVSVADINIGKDGTSDPELFAALSENQRMFRMLSYAGWNTAGNTMGTSIPAANVYLLARRQDKDALQRELSLREFLLHRFVNDYDYHKYVRPQAYRMIGSNRDEVYGTAFNELDEFVRQDLTRYLTETFRNQFLGRKFFAGAKQYEISGMNDVRVFLPWPRAYEVRLEFKLEAVPATTSESKVVRS